MKKYIIPTLIGLLIGSSTMLAATNIFSDLKGDEFYYNAALELESKEIINGYDDGTLKGDQEITRGEVMMIVSNLLGYLEKQEVQEEEMEEEVDEGPVYYESEELGISFELVADLYKPSDLKEKDNWIGFVDYEYDQIGVFDKDEGQSIEEAILALVENEEKNPEDCVVLPAHDKYKTVNGIYKLDLADPENINYTQEELARIQEAEIKEANGELEVWWDFPDAIKDGIYIDHLVEKCTNYAHPGRLGGKKAGSLFHYNEYVAPDRFALTIDLYGDASEFHKNSVEFL